MGDPMAPSDSEGNSEGGGSARWFASLLAKRRASPVHNSLKWAGREPRHEGKGTNI